MKNFERDIAEALKTYTKEVTEAMDKEKEKVAKEGAKTLKKTSPKKSGKYAKGWRAKKDGNNWVIFNATRGNITHLLEHGHALKQGGRVAGKPHIYPVEQDLIKQYEQGIERVIKG